MKLQTILEHLESLAPPRLAAEWDNVGLLMGDRSAAVDKALLCIDLTPAVVKEALADKAKLIVSYHPPIFRPITKLTCDDWQGRALWTCASHGLAIYSPHTALDAARGGVNDWLVGGLGEGKVEPLEPITSEAAQVKLVVFVPVRDAGALRTALAKAGAGRIGQYSECSFATPGTGTFRGDAESHPTIGQAGRSESVEELRLEMVCTRSKLAAVVTALHETHRYETPAYDIYPLETPPGDLGQGRCVTLKKPITQATLVSRLKKHLGVKQVKVAGPTGTKIKRIAVCAGSGGSVVAATGQADAWVTGEMTHHHVLDAAQRGITVLLAGHTHTERPYLAVYRKRLAKLTNSGGGGNSGGVSWRVSRADRSAMQVM